MKKLNNKGISLIEVTAAAVILSFLLLVIHNNVINAVRLNEISFNRIEAFNNAELLANHFSVLEDSGIADMLNPDNELVTRYTSEDCYDANSPIRNILDTSGLDSSYCESLFLPDYNVTYTSGMVELYFFESLENNFNLIIADTSLPVALRNYASTYDGSYYSEGLNLYNVDNVVVIIYFFEDVPVTYGEVMIYEIPSS